METCVCVKTMKRVWRNKSSKIIMLSLKFCFDLLPSIHWLFVYSLQEVCGSTIHYEKLEDIFVLRKFDNAFISLTAFNNVFELINSRIFTLQSKSIVTI